jgi:hypothetical protein
MDDPSTRWSVSGPDGPLLAESRAGEDSATDRPRESRKLPEAIIGPVVTRPSARSIRTRRSADDDPVTGKDATA